MTRKWRNSLPWILLGCFLLTAAVAFHAYCIARDRYAASYTLYALPADTNADESALERSRMLSRDCGALLDTEAFRAILDDKRASDATAGASVSGLDGTHLIRITATSEVATVAGELANALGEAMLAKARDMLMARDVTEIERAVTPQEAFAPNRPLRIALTAALSFVLLSLLGCWLGSSRERARYRSLTSARQGLPYLGALPDERESVRLQRKAQRHAGTGTLYSKSSHRMVESLRELALRLRALDKAGRASIVTISSMGGDCAAISLLLASALAEQRLRVLLIDMDGGEHALGELLGVRGRRDLADYLCGECTLGEALLSTPVRDLTFIDGLKASGELSRMLATRAFEQFLSAMSAEYDYVLMRTRPAVDSADSAMAGRASDITLLTVENGRCELGVLQAAANRLASLTNRPVGIAYTRVPADRL